MGLYSGKTTGDKTKREETKISEMDGNRSRNDRRDKYVNNGETDSLIPQNMNGSVHALILRKN